MPPGRSLSGCELGKTDANGCRSAGICRLGLASGTAALAKIDNFVVFRSDIDSAWLPSLDSSLSGLVLEREKLGRMKIDPQLFGKQGTNTFDQNSRAGHAKNLVEMIKAAHAGIDVDSVSRTFKDCNAHVVNDEAVAVP